MKIDDKVIPKFTVEIPIKINDIIIGYVYIYIKNSIVTNFKNKDLEIKYISNDYNANIPFKIERQKL